MDITWHLVQSESHCTTAATCEPSRGVWTICENDVLLCSMDGFETIQVCTQSITCRDLARDGKRMEYTKSGRVKPLDHSSLRVRCGCKRTDSNER